jgi:hypothetical protein
MKPDDDKYSVAETKRRAEAALKRMLATPRMPHALTKAKKITSPSKKRTSKTKPTR